MASTGETSRLGIAAAALGAVALLSVSAPSNSVALSRPGMIRITDREVKHRRVDLGSPGLSLGDLSSLRYLLFNKGITPKPIGHSELVCTSTGNRTSSCSGMFFLPKGKIVVGGIISSRLFYELAVLGGTGLYDNVRGTLTVIALGIQPSRELLVFRLGI
jgi:hypothetical protein